MIFVTLGTEVQIAQSYKESQEWGLIEIQQNGRDFLPAARFSCFVRSILNAVSGVSPILRPSAHNRRE